MMHIFRALTNLDGGGGRRGKEEEDVRGEFMAAISPIFHLQCTTCI